MSLTEGVRREQQIANLARLPNQTKLVGRPVLFNLSGKWRFDRATSDDITPLLLALGVGWGRRRSIAGVNTIKIVHSQHMCQVKHYYSMTNQRITYLLDGGHTVSELDGRMCSVVTEVLYENDGPRNVTIRTTYPKGADGEQCCTVDVRSLLTRTRMQHRTLLLVNGQRKMVVTRYLNKVETAEEFGAGERAEFRARCAEATRLGKAAGQDTWMPAGEWAWLRQYGTVDSIGAAMSEMSSSSQESPPSPRRAGEGGGDSGALTPSPARRGNGPIPSASVPNTPSVHRQQQQQQQHKQSSRGQRNSEADAMPDSPTSWWKQQQLKMQRALDAMQNNNDIHTELDVPFLLQVSSTPHVWDLSGEWEKDLEKSDRLDPLMRALGVPVSAWSMLRRHNMQLLAHIQHTPERLSVTERCLGGVRRVEVILNGKPCVRRQQGDAQHVSQFTMAGLACSSGLELVDENWKVDTTNTATVLAPSQPRHGEGPGAVVTHTKLPGGVEIVDVRRLVDRLEMRHTTEILRDGASAHVSRATWRRVETRREQLVGNEAWQRLEDTRASGVILHALKMQVDRAKAELVEAEEDIARNRNKDDGKEQGGDSNGIDDGDAGGDKEQEREAQAAHLMMLKQRLSLQQKQYSQTLDLVKKKTEGYRKDTEAAARHKMLSLLAHNPEKQVEYAQLAVQRLVDRKEHKASGSDLASNDLNCNFSFWPFSGQWEQILLPGGFDLEPILVHMGVSWMNRKLAKDRVVQVLSLDEDALTIETKLAYAHTQRLPVTGQYHALEQWGGAPPVQVKLHLDALDSDIDTDLTIETKLPNNKHMVSMRRIMGENQMRETIIITDNTSGQVVCQAVRLFQRNLDPQRGALVYEAGPGAPQQQGLLGPRYDDFA